MPAQDNDLTQWYQYRGWSVMAGCFLCTLLAVGGTIYVFGLFIVPVSEEFALSRADTNNGLILAMLGMAIWSPIIGRLLDRFSARLIMCFGALMYATGFSLIASSQSLGQIAFAIVGPVALAVTSAGALAGNTVTARWFQRHRGRALGILAVSTSAGGFLMTPLFAALIDNYGWRDALDIVSIAIPLLMIATIALVIRNTPSASIKIASGEFDHASDAPSSVIDSEANSGEDSSSDERNSTALDEKDWAYADIIRHPNFWLIGFGTGLLLASDSALIATKVPYLLDQGFSYAKAAFFVSCTTASAVCGKIIVGFLADRINLKHLFALVVFCHLVLLSTLAFTPPYYALIAVALVFGTGMGGVYPVWLAMSAASFGARSYGTVVGAMGMIIQPLSIVTIRLIGEVHDRTGDYSLGFMIFAALVALALLLVARVRL